MICVALMQSFNRNLDLLHGCFVTLCPGRGTKYCNEHDCVSLCLSTHISQKPHVQISRNILHILPVAVDSTARCCVFMVYG